MNFRWFMRSIRESNLNLIPLLPEKHSATGAPSKLLLSASRLQQVWFPAQHISWLLLLDMGWGHQQQQGNLSVPSCHSDCYLLFVSCSSISLVWKENSPSVCSVLFADAWKLQTFRNIHIFLAVQLFFVIFWLWAVLCACKFFLVWFVRLQWKK